MKANSQETFEQLGLGQQLTATAGQVRKWALDVFNRSTVYTVGTDTVTSYSAATKTITVASHAAKPGDLIKFSSGNCDTLIFSVFDTTTNTIILNEEPSVAPAGSDTFSILRFTPQVITAGGASAVGVQFTLDGSSQDVVKSTGTPANNKPLPVEILDTTGVVDVRTALGRIPALGQALMAASQPVVIASNQSAVATTNAILDACVTTNKVQVDVATAPATLATAANQTAGNSSLADIKTAVELIDNAIAGTEMQVDVVAALPAGDNNIGNVDIVTLPGTVQTDIGAIKTAVELIDNAISGSEMQVDVVGALPAGTNTIGNVNVNQLDIIDTAYVDFSSSNLPGNATNPVQLVASTAAAIKAIQVFDTGGNFMEIMTGAVASEVRKVLVGPGSNETVPCAINASTRVSVRRIDSASAATAGAIAVNFLG